MESWNFVICHGILPSNFIHSSFCFDSTKIFFYLFCKMSRRQNSGRDMVMENQELVMERSWKNILGSLWEP